MPATESATSPRLAWRPRADLPRADLSRADWSRSDRSRNDWSRTGVARRGRRAIARAAAISLASLCLYQSPASAQTWNNPNSGSWSVGANWIGSSPPASSSTTSLTFNALASQSYTATQNIAAPFTLNAITFNPASTGTINLAGSSISLAGTNPSITISGAGGVSIANALQLAASSTIGGAGTGTITLLAPLSSATTATGTTGAMLTKSSPGTLSLSGGGTLYALRVGSGALNISAGTFTLTSTQLGNDVYSGGNDGGSVSLAVGASGSAASATISGTASLSVQNAFAGNDASSTGTLTISGANAQLLAASRIGVNYGTGTIAILNGATANTQFVELGRQVGSSGNLIVDGAGSSLTTTSDMSAPVAGLGSSVRVSNGAVVTIGGNTALAFAGDGFGAITSSNATLSISGTNSLFNCTGDGQSSGVLIAGIGDVGVAAAASISVSSGASLHTSGALLGNAAGFASLSISGAGSGFINDGELDLLSSSTSTISISSAGSWTNNGNVFLAPYASDKVQISVAGTNSLADLSNAPQVIVSGGGSTSDASGSSTIAISSGGEMRANLISAADALGSRALLSVDGTNSKLTIEGSAGDNLLILANSAGAIGTLNVTNGGALRMSPTSLTTGRIFLAPALASGTYSAAQANVTISGAGSALSTGTAGANLYVGGYSNISGQTIDGGTANFSVLSNASVDLKQLAYVGSKSTLTVGGGATPASFSSGSLVVNGTVNFNAGTLLTSGTLSVGGTVRLSSASRVGSGTLNVPTNKKTLEAGSLTVTGSGVIDLDDNDALFHNNTEAQIDAFIKSARNGGSWNGIGLTSTSAKNNTSGTTGLAAITGQQYKTFSVHSGTTSFNGRPIANSDILVKYTYDGDVDLDGRVTGADYARIDTTFAKEATLGNIGGWSNGDFNYDGRVDGADYALIDLAFAAQNNVTLGRQNEGTFAGPGDRPIILAGVDLSAAPGLPIDIDQRLLQLPDAQITPSSTVPEPTMLPISALAGCLIARRRRHR